MKARRVPLQEVNFNSDNTVPAGSGTTLDRKYVQSWARKNDEVIARIIAARQQKQTLLCRSQSHEQQQTGAEIKPEMSRLSAFNVCYPYYAEHYAEPVALNLPGSGQAQNSDTNAFQDSTAMMQGLSRVLAGEELEKDYNLGTEPGYQPETKTLEDSRAMLQRLTRAMVDEEEEIEELSDQLRECQKRRDSLCAQVTSCRSRILQLELEDSVRNAGPHLVSPQTRFEFGVTPVREERPANIIPRDSGHRMLWSVRKLVQKPLTLSPLAADFPAKESHTSSVFQLGTNSINEGPAAAFRRALQERAGGCLDIALAAAKQDQVPSAHKSLAHANGSIIDDGIPTLSIPSLSPSPSVPSQTPSPFAVSAQQDDSSPKPAEIPSQHLVSRLIALDEGGPAHHQNLLPCAKRHVLSSSALTPSRQDDDPKECCLNKAQHSMPSLLPPPQPHFPPPPPPPPPPPLLPPQSTARGPAKKKNKRPITNPQADSPVATGGTCRKGGGGMSMLQELQRKQAARALARATEATPTAPAAEASSSPSNSSSVGLSTLQSRTRKGRDGVDSGKGANPLPVSNKIFLEAALRSKFSKTRSSPHANSCVNSPSVWDDD